MNYHIHGLFRNWDFLPKFTCIHNQPLMSQVASFYTYSSLWPDSCSCSQHYGAKGQDQTLAHAGGGSRGFFSDHTLWLWAIRGTLQEMVFLEGHFRPHITLEILAAQPSWKETPGIQWELLQGSFGARKSQAAHYRQAHCCDIDCWGTSEESASKRPSP